MALTITQLRADLFVHLDRVLTTGEPLVIERKGRVLTVTADQPVRKLNRLVRRSTIVGDPDEMVLPTPSTWTAGQDLTAS